MKSSLLDLIILHSNSSASAAFAEGRAEGAQYPEEWIRQQKSSEKKAAMYLTRIKRILGHDAE